MQLYNDKCENVLCQFEADSIDAMVTDPPAGIAFMGKDWDKDHGGRDNWIAYMTGIFEQCLRVLKPGAHGLVWALPRTSHWTATALEDAGFEIRDIVNHIFGSGFPKSHNIGVAVDKLQGNEREDLGQQIRLGDKKAYPLNSSDDTLFRAGQKELKNITRGISEWEGWGTALKPACEHWILCRKPLSEKTVAQNVLKYGTGGINVDGCRVGTDEKLGRNNNARTNGTSYIVQQKTMRIDNSTGKGRFPANVILDDSEVVRAGFPNTKSGGYQKGSRMITKGTGGEKTGNIYGAYSGVNHESQSVDDGTGSAARFFYCAKASKRDRDEGLEGFEEKMWSLMDNRNRGGEDKENYHFKTGNGNERNNKMRNNHPTVKSTELMRYLCRLITPPGGTVLDPFMGSGSTGKGAILEGFDFIGIEQDAEYFKIAEARINFVLNKTDDQLRMAI